MTNKGSPYNSSHPSVLAVLVLLLVAVVAMTENVVVVASSSGAAFNGAKCNGSIAECHIEEEGELLLVVGDSENSLQRSLLAQPDGLSYKGVLDPDHPPVDSKPGQPYSQKVNPGTRPCSCFKGCKGNCGGGA